MTYPRVLVVVVHNLDQLGEVPAVPLPHTHHKRVDILVESVEQRDGLATGTEDVTASRGVKGWKKRRQAGRVSGAWEPLR
jgi:hypothetical protein